jgi:UDP-N-acetylglucosamine 2-epimerase
VQEEAPSLGKALLVLRENTERPEAIRSGVAKLVGGDPKVLREMLEDNYASEAWLKTINKVPNPFGDGTAAKQIVDVIEGFLLKDLH